MNRKILKLTAVIVMLLLVLSLSACGGSDTEAEEPAGEEVTEEAAEEPAEEVPEVLSVAGHTFKLTSSKDNGEDVFSDDEFYDQTYKFSDDNTWTLTYGNGVEQSGTYEQTGDTVVTTLGEDITVTLKVVDDTLVFDDYVVESEDLSYHVTNIYTMVE